MNPDIWGVFHDGVVTNITNDGFGTIGLTLDIAYLRGMFSGDGTTFQISLRGCSSFTYSEYESTPSSDLARIQELQPEILYVQSTSPIVIDCAGGVLEMSYDEMSVHLPDGRQLTYEQLVAASRDYWQRWSEQSQ